jgi:hypothetical protein
VYASLVGLREESLYGGTLRVLLILFLLSMLVVIVALHLLQGERQRYGSRVMIGFATAFVGMALTVGGYIIGIEGVGAALFLVGVAVATAGIVVLAAATSSVGVLPWWGGVALVAGTPFLGLLTIAIFIGSYPTSEVGSWRRLG